MAGTTNLLQWNPTAANQETDAQYLADSQRSGGATNPSTFNAALANKLFYQMSTYLTGLFTAFANKGFTTSDASVATLAAQCANFVTTADILPNLQTIPYAPNLTFDCSKANGFQVTLAGVLSVSIVNATVGQHVTLAFTQNATGNYPVTLSGSITGYGTVAYTPGMSSVQQFIVLADGVLHPLTPMTVS